MLTRAQIDWWLDNLGSPVSPLEWFTHLRAPAGLGWLLALVKWLVVTVWAIAFIWVWFTLFLVFFVLEYTVLERAHPAAPPSAPTHSAGASSATQAASEEKETPPPAE